MREVGNLKRIGEEFSKQDAGTLSIATTHSQARYFLPEPVAQLRKRFPKVNISLHQGTPEQVAQDGARGGRRHRPGHRVARRASPTSSPCPATNGSTSLVLPAGHPLAQVERISLEELAPLPLISYHPSFTGRKRIDAAFATRQLKPNIVLEAIDADVIKTYVRARPGRRHRRRDRDARRSARRRPGARGRSATCSARTSRASPSSAAPTCATSSTPSPRCCPTA